MRSTAAPAAGAGPPSTGLLPCEPPNIVRVMVSVREDSLASFDALHRPALEKAEARHNIILAVLGAAATNPSMPLRLWTAGEPGACALQPGQHHLVLGDLDEVACRALAVELSHGDHSGVRGPAPQVRAFVAAAREQGATFGEPMPQRIHQLRAAPRYPDAPGSARVVGPGDTRRLQDWMAAFAREALPQDAPPKPERAARAAASGEHLFWEVDGEPVAMAGVVRHTPHAACLSFVYTPPEHRNRGYAGCVTAAVVDHAFAAGKTIACLYTDLQNPYSNRCYAKIGFEPVCDCLTYFRASPPT